VLGGVGEALSRPSICPGHEESKSVATSAWDSELIDARGPLFCLLVAAAS
jgi:hypothetical protein